MSLVKEDVFGGSTTCNHTNVAHEPACNHVSCEDCGQIFAYTPQQAPSNVDDTSPLVMEDVPLSETEIDDDE